MAKDKPYRIINKTNGLVVEWCTYEEYITRWSNNYNFDMTYLPGKKSKKKEFPYNG